MTWLSDTNGAGVFMTFALTMTTAVSVYIGSLVWKIFTESVRGQKNSPIDTEHYARVARPDDDESKRTTSSPRKVYLSLRILRMDSIDESADTFDASMLIFIVWRDDIVTADKNYGDELSVDEFEGNRDAFKPSVTMPNMKEGQEDFWTPRGESRPKVLPASLLPEIFAPSVKKILLQVIPVTGTFNEEFELQAFPFDVQIFHLIFRPKEDSSKVELQSLLGTRFKSSISRFVQTTVPGFTIQYPRVECLLDTVSMNRPYSVMQLVVVAERRSAFFLYTFYSLLVIIQLCTFMLFAGDYHVDNRFPNLLSLLLTITGTSLRRSSVSVSLFLSRTFDVLVLFAIHSNNSLKVCCERDFTENIVHYSSRSVHVCLPRSIISVLSRKFCSHRRERCWHVKCMVRCERNHRRGRASMDIRHDRFAFRRI